MSLNARFWHTPLNETNEEVHDLFVVHDFDHFPVDFGEHQVTLLVLERIVETVLRTLLQTCDERLNFVQLRVWILNEDLTGVERINNVLDFASGRPLTLHQIVALVFGAHIFGVNRGESLQMLRDASLLKLGQAASSCCKSLTQIHESRYW